jgi:hypothetical protein
MKKLSILIFAVFMMIAFVLPAGARPYDPYPDNGNCVTRSCIDNSIDNSGNNRGNSDSSHHNNYGTINNGLVYEGEGPLVTNLNTNLNTNFNTNKTEVDVDNTNINTNTSVNTNLNNNELNQDQDQVQLQGQDQDQKQGQSQDQANVQVLELTQIYEEKVSYNHISPDIGNTNADIVRGGQVNDARLYGYFQSISAITLQYAKNMSRDSDDVKEISALMYEKDFRTHQIKKVADADAASMHYMGTKTFVPSGADVSADGMFGVAMVAGMDAGATHFQIVRVTAGEYNSGSKAGFDLGGASSIATKADGSVVIAPGATLGYSTAWTSNDMRPGLAVAYFFDPTLKITPAVSYINSVKLER